jgi:osmotically-inducible protein OsmY
MQTRTMKAAAAGTVIGAGAALLLDPQSGRRRRATIADRTRGTARRSMRIADRAERRAHGFVQRVSHLHEQPKPPLNDADLAAKVMSIVFRPPDVPKGSLNVNVEYGVVVLRGEVPHETLRRRLEEAAAGVPGVRAVQNLTHLPGEPAPDDPRLALRRDTPPPPTGS